MNSTIEYSSKINKDLLIKVLENLYKTKKTFPYSALAFILSPDELLNFFDYFGGTTLEVPTKEEFLQVVQSCLVDAIGDYDLAKTANPEMLHGLSRIRYDKISKKINQ